MIKNIHELCLEVGDHSDDHDFERCKARIARRLYKSTSCGISFWTDGAKVLVAGYCEGSDGHIEPQELRFPFDAEVFWKACDTADDDGCEEWSLTHGCDDCGPEDQWLGSRPVREDCETCEGAGVVI